jgi:hypothetical protein
MKSSPENCNARQWAEISNDSISVESIGALHSPSSHYRISPNSYNAGTEFVGRAQAGRIYVIAGQCTRVVGTWEAHLVAGTFADFPGGEFKFQVPGDQPVKLVHVWLIPERYRVKGAV